MDCKVSIRKYVLVASPSRWAQKGDRVVVQSPVQNITNELVIPVRRFNGDDENSVCFMPTQDIEKDGSIAYKRAMVTSTTASVDTHGVALFESNSDFTYRPGDKFWLFITANRNGYENEVPVINLRTMATGSVPISHVCWFPKMRGPNSEVWTFGGSIGRLKHSGKNHYTFWTWGICQYLDGEPAITKQIQVPDRSISTDKQRWLSPADARPLFSQVYENMMKDCQIIPPSFPAPRFSAAWVERCKMLSKSLYTPPTSPSTDSLDEGSGSAPMLIFKKLDMASWKSIIDSTSKATPVSLRSSVIQPQRTLSSPDRKKYRRTEADVDIRSNSGSSDKSARSSTRSSFLTMGDDFRSHSDDPSKLILDQNGRVILGPLYLVDTVREEAKQLDLSRTHNTEQPVLSVAHPLLRTKPTILSKIYQMKKNMLSIEFPTSKHTAELCDRGKYHCEWSLRFTSKHYHPDHMKCIFAKYLPYHEHCVFAERALPNVAGSCLLNEGAREHECCVGEEEDMPILARKEFDTGKIVEARRYLMASYDKSFEMKDSIRDESKKIKEENWYPFGLDVFFDEYGKRLKDDLGNINYYDEISKLFEVEDDDDEDQSQDQLHHKDCVDHMYCGC